VAVDIDETYWERISRNRNGFIDWSDSSNCMYYKRCKLEESYTEGRRKFSRIVDVDINIGIDEV
jgi:hypothetical protein